MLRRMVAALVLIPLAIIIVAFAVANRQIVTISFDPFSGNEPAAAVKLPLFAIFIFALIIGVWVGGTAAWLRQGKWRHAARRLEREVGDLRAKIDALEGRAGDSSIMPNEGSPPRLKLRPPIR